MVTEALESSRSQGAIPSVLEGTGAVSDRIQRPPSGTRAVTTIQQVLRLVCGYQLRTGPLPPCVCQGGHASGPGRAVCFRTVTASDQCGPGALRLQPRPHCLHGALPVGCLGAGGHVVSPTGRLFLQALPAGEHPRGIHAAAQIPQPVSRVSLCCVGSPPQGGWLLVLRSDRVRQQLPVRAPDCRHVLPPVVGFPHLCGLCGIRHPIRIRRACPVTVLLRLPVPCATVERRVQPCAVAGFPLRCLRSGIPSSKVCHVQERLGLPTFFDGSLPACHGLRTPADRHPLAKSVARRLPAGAFKPSASAMAMAKLSQHCRVRGHPGGLQDARSTLRPSCAPFYCTTPPWTPDSIRVGGYPFPDRDLHPARDAKLAWRDNARRQARRVAGATQARRLFAVACKPLLGCWAPTRGPGPLGDRPPPPHASTTRATGCRNLRRAVGDGG